MHLIKYIIICQCYIWYIDIMFSILLTNSLEVNTLIGRFYYNSIIKILIFSFKIVYSEKLPFIKLV